MRERENDEELIILKRRKYPELKDIKLQIQEFKYAQNNEYGKNYTQKLKIWKNASVCM